MSFFTNDTLYQIMPDLLKIPVLKFLNNNLYFLLDAKKKDARTLELELMQVAFDRRAGELLPLRSFKQEEEAVTLPDGSPWPKRFRRVDWRYEEPEQILAVQKLLPQITTLKNRQASQKVTQFFHWENVYTQADRHITKGPATTPENPEIETPAKPSMIVDKKVWR